MKNTYTVVIPCYNSENFISTAIKSVLAQTFEVDELIIVDDGSSDNSVEVVENLFEQNNFRNIRLTIIKNLHQGPGAARNTGIKQANSNWICFLDSDDYWEKNKIELIDKYINQNKKVNFFCHDENVFKINGTKSISNYSKYFRSDFPLFNQLYYKNFFSTSAVVCKKILFSKNNLFNTNLMSAQDYELWIRISDKINLLFVPKILGNYIERKGNITSGNLYKRMLNEIIIANMYKHRAGLLLFILRLSRIFTAYIYYYLKRIIL